ncbi:acetylglutamate kinase [Kaustia mangrovi]|uniref:Acetylglutamate kinase n=1 Tax=Kaustia mangrovi TaxID=2593653 RepID=A0A7S8C5L3_9HYPH|nr:acetylglutamate kinase [Kaustia mangrovi]QPC43832.1 acetylglutamate kinase [Kaustia mangrovi]
MTKPSGETAVPHISREDKAKVLSEALPFMQRYDGRTVVVKYGGHAMGSPELSRRFARDIVQLKQSGINPIVVHGGGPQIGRMLERLQINSAFEDGLRVTDRETVGVVEMVLAGSINKQVVADIQYAGGRAIGISGKDGNLVVARKLRRTRKDPDSNIERILDLGFVGEPEEVNADVLEGIAASDAIPVIAPIGTSPEGDTYNINADTFAGAIAVATGAKRLLLLTDVEGVLDRNKRLIRELSLAEARRLVHDGTISGGMIPKIETCISVVEQGVEGAVILDGRVPHIVLLELFTEHGVGTRVSMTGASDDD